jgi:hypothetical protein
MSRIKLVLAALFAVSFCSGAQSIFLKNGAQATGTFPSKPALKSIGGFRYEFRLHNITDPADNLGWIFTVGNIWVDGFAVRFIHANNGQLNFSDRPDNFVNALLELSGRTDVIVRCQRDWTNSRLTMEAWNPDGSHYTHSETPLLTPVRSSLTGSSMSLGAPTASANLAYLRIYSTVLPENSPPPSRSDGDLGDWELEGNLADKSGTGTNLTGSVSYIPTPVAPINVTFGQLGSQRVWNVNGGSLSLDSSSTYSSADDPAFTYAWTQISGPATGSFSAPTAVTSTFSASVPGDYLIRLTASDGVTTDHLDVDFGAVKADSSGIIQTGNAAMDTALGPLTMWGTALWPWYDVTEMANADSLYPLVTVPPVYGQTALAGTVTPTGLPGSLSVVGTGTHFISDIIDCRPASASTSAYTCTIPGITQLSDMNLRDRFFRPDVDCGGSVTIRINSFAALPLNNPACTAGSIHQLYYNSSSSDFSINSNQPLVWFWWDAPDGKGTGRMLETAYIVDDTHMNISSYYWLPPIAQSTNIQYSHPDTGELGIYWNYVGQPSNNLNYYDVVHALYKLYYRTNLTKYLTEARTFADNWYIYGADQGYYIGRPRSMGYMGMIDRAIDGHYTIWQALDVYLSWPSDVTDILQLTTPQPVGYQFDTRETGYQARYVARAAALFGNGDGTPNLSKRAAYCTQLHNVTANVLASTQDSLGQWETDLYSVNISTPAAKLNGRFGSSPWRDAMSGLALEEAYPILAGNCNDPTTAATALKTVIKFANLLHDQGQGTGFGQFGNINYASTQYTNIHAYSIAVPGQFVTPLTTGKLSVTEGSPMVSGSGTNFTAVFSKVGHNPVMGVDPAFIGIPAQRANPASCSVVLPVASVQSDTQLTLSAPWSCASASAIDGAGFGWIGSPAAASNCAILGSLAQTCEGIPDPSLSHEVHAIWSWLYWQTHDRKYFTWALQSAGTDYGGRGGGPGTPTAPVGPFATGNVGNFLWALPSCGAPDFAAPPCGGFGAVNSRGKNYAFSAGAGNANNAFAYLVLGSPRTEERILRIEGAAKSKGKIK